MKLQEQGEGGDESDTQEVSTSIEEENDGTIKRQINEDEVPEVNSTDSDQPKKRQKTSEDEAEVKETPEPLSPPNLHATNSVIESIRANFFEQHQIQTTSPSSSALRDQLLLQPPTRNLSSSPPSNQPSSSHQVIFNLLKSF